jgi:hypothetical protein
LIVGLVYIVGVSLTYAIIATLHVGDVNISLVTGSVLGAVIGALLYHRRESATAPFSVKASVGLLMAILCVIQSLLFQALWGWQKFPEVSIPIGAVGSFLFPFVLYGTIQKALVKAKEGKRTK